MPSRDQLWRDTVLATVIAIATSLFYLAIYKYLSGLQKPFLLIFAFTISLIISCTFEIRNDRNREGFVAVAATAILFAAGVYIADSLRLYYMDLLSRVDEINGAKELIGEEYLYLASSKVVGYAGAYGLGLIITRLIGRSILIKTLSEHLILTKYRTNNCFHCQQKIT